MTHQQKIATSASLKCSCSKKIWR